MSNKFVSLKSAQIFQFNSSAHFDHMSKNLGKCGKCELNFFTDANIVT